MYKFYRIIIIVIKWFFWSRSEIEEYSTLAAASSKLASTDSETATL